MPFFSPLGCHDLGITVPLTRSLPGCHAGYASSAAKGDLEEKENRVNFLLCLWLRRLVSCSSCFNADALDPHCLAPVIVGKDGNVELTPALPF